MMQITQIQQCNQIIQKVRAIKEDCPLKKMMITRMMFMCLSHVVFQIQ